MDLRERKFFRGKKHPWELARLRAVKMLLSDVLRDDRHPRILDVGCGDGFVCRALSGAVSAESVTGIDTNLSDEEVSALTGSGEGVMYFNDYRGLKERHYSVGLLLDVLEHIPNDEEFLSGIRDGYLEPGGHALITAPAFPSLMGPHDRFLGHYRRYTREALLGLVHSAGMECVLSGFLFPSLLPVRLGQRVIGGIRPTNEEELRGVGGWDRGEALTKGLEWLMHIDNRASIRLARIGLRIPGLTVWAICRNPR